MEKVGCSHASPMLKKGKKKQAKDELDRQKQAEKKRRRLEKALATSAAIRSELEKKKQKKIEEQQRLDEEGAAIAEAVALHVLVGEDTEESCQYMLNNNERFIPWDHSSNIGLFRGYKSAYESGCKWNAWKSEQSLPCGVHVTDLQPPFYEAFRGGEISAELIAAQAVSSLQIAEDSHENSFSGQGVTTVVINTMLRGSNISDKIDLYKEF